MSPEEALAKAKEIVSQSDDPTDPAETHPKLDDLLCEVLRSLGYNKLVDYYFAIDRWFE